MSSLGCHLRACEAQSTLLLRTVSGSVALHKQGSVLMSMVHVTTKGHVEVPGLGCCLRPCRCLRAEQSYLPLNAFSTPERWLGTLPGLHSRTGPGGGGALVNWPQGLESRRAGPAPYWGKSERSWRSDQLSYHPGPDPGL